MNIRAFMVLGAISAIALGACVVVPGTGSTSDNTGGSVGTGGTGAGVGGTGGTGGAAAMCDPDLKCATAISDSSKDVDDLCDESGTLYDAWFDCVCKSGSACGAQCGTAQCAFNDTAACGMCVTMNCSMVQNECANDF